LIAPGQSPDASNLIQLMFFSSTRGISFLSKKINATIALKHNSGIMGKKK
jgi:hypothetical protein